MDRKKYYVSMQSREISQIKYGNNADFTIYATDEEVRLLRAKFDNMYGADLLSHVRAHVPFVPYHKDSANDEYDQGMTEAFQMIYDLGDEQSKQHLEDMGVLGDQHM